MHSTGTQFRYELCLDSVTARSNPMIKRVVFANSGANMNTSILEARILPS